MQEILQLFGSHQTLFCASEEEFYQFEIEKFLKAIHTDLAELRAKNTNYRASEIYAVVKEWSENQAAKVLYFRLRALWISNQAKNATAFLGIVEAITNS
jgi:hypothetical protein